MKEITSTPSLSNMPPSQDFIGPLATAVNYIVRIAPIVYMAFQAQPASPVGVQPDSDMGCGNHENAIRLVTVSL
ncbi:hypothetical protein DSO57_1010320 [Entomophthora muscae]|uniref:Uncharacterized protein n=1 Tax=Entomophthora muscae TaxID=34485 RepID=A0ACC2SVE4_9FUNG|nr:hypothetical protein DSO57_1010320 [Entomophthora muscae]